MLMDPSVGKELYTMIFVLKQKGLQGLLVENPPFPWLPFPVGIHQCLRPRGCGHRHPPLGDSGGTSRGKHVGTWNAATGLGSVFICRRPVDVNEHEEFNDTLSMLVNSVPKSLNFIGGHDVNANLGIRKELSKGVIGPFGIDNRNMKGRILLSVLSQNRLRVTNSYFKKPYLVTWRSFNASISPHMLDVITTSD